MATPHHSQRFEKVIDHLKPIKSHDICDYDLLDECTNLCQWMYQVNIENNEISLPKPTTLNVDSYSQINFDHDYAIFRSHTKDNSDSIFVVFRGTQNLKDVISDIGVNLQKIQDSEQNIISHVHSGIYVNMKNNFWSIHNEVKQYLNKNNNIKNIIITGHSLGGGQASLYLFEALKKIQRNKDKQLDLYNNYNTKIITFGSPLVFAQKQSNTHNMEIFEKLNRISHHFINGWDVVPRLLGIHSWFELAAYALKKKAPYALAPNVAMAGEWIMGFGVETVTNKLREFGVLETFNDYYGV